MKKLRIEQVRKEAFDKYSLVLLSSVYESSHKPLKWKYDGNDLVFTRSWSNIKSGYLGVNNINDYENDKKFIENFKNLGYKLEQDKQQYLVADRIGANDRVFIVSNPKMEGYWKVTKRNFARSAETHLNNSGMNFGELIIYSILSSSNIDFKQEYSVYINGDRHIFDFLLPKYKLFIEYDGIQHYKPIEYFGGDVAYENRVKRDREKEKFSKSIGYKIVHIPYTCNDENSIIAELPSVLDTNLVCNEVKFSGKVLDIAEYYSMHSSKDTCEKYSINRTTVNKYYKLVYGKAKVIRNYAPSRRKKSVS